MDSHGGATHLLRQAASVRSISGASSALKEPVARPVERSVGLAERCAFRLTWQPQSAPTVSSESFGPWSTGTAGCARSAPLPCAQPRWAVCAVRCFWSGRRPRRPASPPPPCPSPTPVVADPAAPWQPVLAVPAATAHCDVSLVDNIKLAAVFYATLGAPLYLQCGFCSAPAQQRLSLRWWPNLQARQPWPGRPVKADQHASHLASPVHSASVAAASNGFCPSHELAVLVFPT